MKGNIELKINYHNGCMVEIVGEPNTQYDESETYEVLFINNQTGKLLHHANLKPNYWTKPSVTYFVEWKIIILKNHGQESEQINPPKKIAFENHSDDDEEIKQKQKPKYKEYKYY